jgi:hypothetical protein
MKESCGLEETDTAKGWTAGWNKTTQPTERTFAEATAERVAK